MASWEFSKENIQPLKSGRRVSAMEEQDSKKLFLKQQEFETALRSCSGNESLQLWYEYILWIEQHFPKGGKEGNLRSLVQKCLQEFEKNEEVFNDDVFLEIWMKYAILSPSPFDVFKHMFIKGICTKRPNFYANWAWETESAGYRKKANQIFEKGLTMMETEEDKNILDSKHKQFQTRTFKILLRGEEVNPGIDPQMEEERTVFASLKGSGKTEKVGSVRIGEVKKSDVPGVLLPSVGLPNKQQPLTFNSKHVAIFQDDENQPPCHMVSQSSSASLSVPDPKISNSENDLPAGKWSGAKIGKKSHAVPIEKISSKPAFFVHEDEDVPLAIPTPQKSVLSSKVLSVIKPAEEHHVALALFEPPDPMKKPMYCKHLVYQGVTEFSFEELRAIKVRRKKAEEETKNLQMEKKLLEEENRRWKEEQKLHILQSEELGRKNREIMLAIEQQRLEFQLFQDEMRKQQEEAFRRLGLFESRASSEKPAPKLPRSFSEKPKKFLAEKDLFPTEDIPKKSSEESLKTPTREMPIPEKLIEPSPTINTKEALILMDQFWGNPKESSSKSTNLQVYEDPISPKVVSQSASSKFEIFSDEPESQKFSFPKPTAKRIAMKVKILKDDKENAVLTLQPDDIWKVPAKCDEPPRKMANCSSPQAETNETVLPSEEDFAQMAQAMSTPFHGRQKFDPVWDENTCKVEILPKTQESGETYLSSNGKLQPPEIRVQCKEDFPFSPSKTAKRNEEMTMQIPTMEDFAQMAKAVSTPHNGRRFVPEPDDNTCKVDIVFKPQPSLIEEKEYQKPQVVPDLPQAAMGSLSTIMETSKEYKSSSSSSSNSSHSVAQLTKSHWGNTQINGSNVSSAIRTPGIGLSSYKASDVTVSSGYIGDNSSARTPGIFLKQNDDVAKMPAPRSVVPLKGNSVFKMPTQVEEGEDELTGDFRELLSEFQRNAGLAASKPVMNNGKKEVITQATKSNDKSLATSDKESFTLKTNSEHFVEGSEGASATKHPMFEDELTLPLSSRKLDKSEYQGRNMKSHSSFLSQSLKVSFLGCDLDVTNVKENAPKKFEELGMTSPNQIFVGHNVNEPSQFLEASRYNLELSEISRPQFDMSSCVDNLKPDRLFSRAELDVEAVPFIELSSQESPSSANQNLSVSSLKINNQTDNWVSSNVNPFSPNLHGHLLQSIPNPLLNRHGFKKVVGLVPPIKTASIVTFADVSFFILECKGEGGFGKVYKALKQDDHSSANATIANKDVVLKVQKPAREWEFYICSEVQSRLSLISPMDKVWFMSIPRCYTFQDGSIFVSDHQTFSLLEVCNHLTSLQSCHIEPIALYFVIEMLKIAEALKLCNIIHADIKPENFLLQNLPTINCDSKSAEELFRFQKPALQVIDFGISIDLQLFPKGTSFVHSFSRGENMSPEMIEGKPWTFQLDYFGIASVAYVLLNSTNMKLCKDKVTEKYLPSGSLKRWWNVELWNEFFDSLLNIKDCSLQPELPTLRVKLQNFFYEKYRTKFDQAISSLNLKLKKNV